ncbi:DoxX family protein [Massilia sp. HP4]|uniref:DoxX family protein n=1 Tax=Massilia sp. HP4 TaxID=2562316 RepID=UPI0010C05777|nr:DoxX family protein [Massilia sp. HP4]
MSNRIDDILTGKASWLAARVLLTMVFALSGAAKIVDFGGGMTEMSRAGLEPAWLFNIAVALVLLAGTLAIWFDRHLWQATALLGGFLVATIFVVHHFWSLPEPRATLSMYVALEHISLVGGLACAAVASACRRTLVRTAG